MTIILELLSRAYAVFSLKCICNNNKSKKKWNEKLQEDCRLSKERQTYKWQGKVTNKNMRTCQCESLCELTTAIAVIKNYATRNDSLCTLHTLYIMFSLCRAIYCARSQKWKRRREKNKLNHVKCESSTFFPFFADLLMSILHEEIVNAKQKFAGTEREKSNGNDTWRAIRQANFVFPLVQR